LKRFDIPYAYSEAFLDAMIQDTWKKRYATYEELEQYMYGSAAVVGLMMSHVIGFKDDALEYAKKLGYAMQLTNFLRDIREDLEQRDRLYLPQDELARYGITEQDLRAHQMSAAMEAFMKFQIARADRLYDEANLGIQLLDRRGRYAVRSASDLYRAILRKIEQQNYNVFLKRASTSTLEKIRLSIQSRFKV
jgi:phytoene synthase